MTEQVQQEVQHFDRFDEGDAIALADQQFFYLPDLADELKITLKTLRKLIAFDVNLGRPGVGSQFPNAYKETPAKTAKIRVPASDVQNYKLKMLQGFNGSENGSDGVS